ncbi:hypothetical protein [Tropicibacter naphthalenivorans]|uniref:PAP2 superfamily protein n=1 Tax=Tropicibacter naphthalenivorans TaxID=441103 RepID=A0A0P1GKM0_9RHOB|nr:hypothetical protein [Tropicibacter naphthalenivorans]CUH82461.1 PAP2 superfamily protein [Tropicibacter naphthalenivorans]SMD07419.1 hypothetical protein SAMN04488093_11559 [Tropicibacter naphthalenivorans]
MITLAANGHSDKLGTAAPVVDNMLTELKDNFGPFLELIAKHNARQNGTPWSSIRASEGKIELTEMGTFEPHPDKNYLLPMAFAEGSPMHPSYGAGHAAVAGACVTVLKAFFKTVDPDNSWTQTLMSEIDAEKVKGLKDIKDLTVEGELNKLAANIAIGRDMAGVHYYSDYYESLRLGERIAVGILHEQMSNYNEPVSMYLKSFDGDRITIKTDGKFDVELDVEGKTADWWLRNTGQTPGPSLSNWQGL